MKKFKILLSVLLIICSLSFIGCKNGNNNPNSNSGNEQNNPPIIAEKSTKDILKLSYEKLNSDFSNENSSGKSFANSGGKNQYNIFVSQALNILKEVSNLEDLKEDTIISGIKLEEEKTDSNSNASINAKLNKVRYLYLTSTKKNNVVNINFDIMLTRTNFDSNPLNFLILSFNISYNTNSNQIEAVFKVENSFSNAPYSNNLANPTTSRADYYMFNYNSKLNLYNGVYFHRTTRFDYNVQDEINERNIKSFNLVMFNFLSMENEITSNAELTLDQNIEMIQTVILNEEELSTEITNNCKELDFSEIEKENISEIFVPVASSIVNLDKN